MHEGGRAGGRAGEQAGGRAGGMAGRRGGGGGGGGDGMGVGGPHPRPVGLLIRPPRVVAHDVHGTHGDDQVEADLVSSKA